MDFQVVLTVFSQILILVIIGAIGFLAMKRKWVPENAGEVVSAVVVRITAPALIFTSMAVKDFGPDKWRDGTILFVSAFIFISLAYAISFFSTKAMKMDQFSASVYQAQSMVGNVIFLSFPLLRILDKENGILYGMFYNFANDIFLWTIVILLLNGHHKTGLKSKLTKILNPNSIAFVLGIIASVFHLGNLVKFNFIVDGTYSIIFESLKGVGETTFYISMLFLGMILANIRYEGIVHLIKTKYSVFVYSFVKLLMVPLIALFVMKTLIPTNGLATSVLVLQLAMPASVTIVALAAQYKANHEYATEILSFSTVFSLITLPFLVYLLYLIPH
ncbi:MAG: AEC family transporter [Clostridia bacterium]